MTIHTNSQTITPTHFLGIDPGVTGAFCILDQDCRILSLADLPTLQQGGVVKRQVDPIALARALQGLPPTTLTVVEGVTARKGNGVASAHSLGFSLGAILGVIAALNLPAPLLPAPALWKRAMSLRASKDTSLRAFAHLWPGYDRPVRHDQAEAALLARFGWINRAQGIQEARRQYEARRTDRKA